MGLRDEKMPNKCLKNASLEDFYKECTKDGVKHILNVLDLPMGAAELPSVPQFRLYLVFSETIYYLTKVIVI